MCCGYPTRVPTLANKTTDYHQASMSLPGGADAPQSNVSAATVQFQLGTQGTTDIERMPDLDHQGDCEKLWLKNYFSRPVKVASYEWAEGTDIFKAFSPLRDYLINANISKKLESYPRLRATVNVEFVLNASPYQYGGVMFALKPLGGPYSVDSRQYGGAYPKSIYTDDESISQMVMLPHVLIDPSTNSSAKLTCPFICPNEWWNVSSTAAYSEVDMASEAFVCSVSVLRTCSAEVGNPIDIAAYVWLTDVELMGATQLNSGDELSSITGAVSAASHALSDVPVIGPVAKAAGVISGAATSVLKFFGFSHPVPKAPVHYVAMNPTTGMSVTQGSVAYDVLATDPGNEMAIGNAGLGYKAPDELTIASIASRLGFLGTGMWNPTDAIDKRLFASAVSPEVHMSSVSLGAFSNPYTAHHMTPMSHLSAAFAYWRGDITFVVRFFPSRFHRGKIKLTFEPDGEVVAAIATDTTRQLSKVIDISQDTTAEFTVPYMAATHWLRVLDDFKHASASEADLHFSFGASTIGYDPEGHNGVFRVDVLNKLSGPNAVDGVPFSVFIKAAEGFEFARPKQINNMLSDVDPATINSADEQASDGVVVPTSTEALPNLRYMGETIYSVREIIKRMCYYTTLKPPKISDPISAARIQTIMRRFPITPGVRATVDTRVRNRGDTANISYALVANTYLSWFGTAHLGMRGGAYWRFVPNDPSTSTTHALTVTRNVPEFDSTRAIHTAYGARDEFFGAKASTDESVPAYHTLYGGAAIDDVVADPSSNGTSVSCMRVNPQNGVSVPMYSRNKFRSTNAVRGISDEDTPLNDAHNDNILIQHDCQLDGTASHRVPSVDAYVAAADDTSFVFYCGPPRMYFSDVPEHAY